MLNKPSKSKLFFQSPTPAEKINSCPRAGKPIMSENVVKYGKKNNFFFFLNFTLHIQMNTQTADKQSSFQHKKNFRYSQAFHSKPCGEGEDQTHVNYLCIFWSRSKSRSRSRSSCTPNNHFLLKEVKAKNHY